MNSQNVTVVCLSHPPSPPAGPPKLNATKTRPGEKATQGPTPPTSLFLPMQLSNSRTQTQQNSNQLPQTDLQKRGQKNDQPSPPRLSAGGRFDRFAFAGRDIRRAMRLRHRPRRYSELVF